MFLYRRRGSGSRIFLHRLTGTILLHLPAPYTLCQTPLRTAWMLGILYLSVHSAHGAFKAIELPAAYLTYFDIYLLNPRIKSEDDI